MARPEDFDAEEPETAEADAIKGRRQLHDLQGIAPLTKLLQSEAPAVLCGAANALYNLCLVRENAEALLPLGTLGRLCNLLDYDDLTVKAAVAGVLMNVCATSPLCRSELAMSGLMPALLQQIVAAGEEPTDGEPEVRKNALGALNNLMLDSSAAKALRTEGGIETLAELLRVHGAGEARLEDAASSLLRSLQEDPKAGDAFVECGGIAVLVSTVTSPNEELQIRVCGLIYELCDQVHTHGSHAHARVETHTSATAPSLPAAPPPSLAPSCSREKRSGGRAVPYIGTRWCGERSRVHGHGHVVSSGASVPGRCPRRGRRSTSSRRSRQPCHCSHPLPKRFRRPRRVRSRSCRGCRRRRSPCAARKAFPS